jgi:hypothetical protein
MINSQKFPSKTQIYLSIIEKPMRIVQKRSTSKQSSTDNSKRQETLKGNVKGHLSKLNGSQGKELHLSYLFGIRNKEK